MKNQPLSFPSPPSPPSLSSPKYMPDFLASWRPHLQRALHRNRSNIFSRYFQLATVDENGYPTNRTVVFRGFLDETNKLEIVTDIRSEKFKHLTLNPYGEICWYFAKTREQFRIKCSMELITENRELDRLYLERKKAWQKLSNAGKEQFYWANPGELLLENQEKKDIEIDEINPVKNFCLVLMNPHQVDHLDLKGNPQNRYIYELSQDNQWTVKQVNP